MNNNSITFSFLIFMLFFSSCLISLARTSKKILNRNESENSCLNHDLEGILLVSCHLEQFCLYLLTNQLSYLLLLMSPRVPIPSLSTKNGWCTTQSSTHWEAFSYPTKLVFIFSSHGHHKVTHCESSSDLSLLC